MRIPHHFLQIPQDICCHLKASLWPCKKSRSSKDCQHHEKSRIFNHSSALPTSTIASFMDILKSQFHLHVLPARVHPGISLMSATLPLKHLKRLSPQLHSLPIGSWTLKLQLRLMPLTMHSPLSFQLWLLMVTCTPLHSTPRTFSALELNYDFHDKELLTIFEAFKWWWHYLEGSGLLIDVSLITVICNTFSMTKILMCQQAHWSQYLSGFNLVIHFHPAKTWNQTWHTH